MTKLVLNTLIVLFLTMLIAGRPDPNAPAPQDSAAMATALPLIAPAPEPATPQTPDARIIPAAAPASDPAPPTAPQPRMPGPALRPSPEHRATDQVQPQDTGAIFTVTANRLNVRAGPSTQDGVLGQITRGEDVLVLSDPAAPWVRIRVEGDGIEGWVARSLLRPAR
ncbi:SH3 domain-containing protein [Phaeovulum sp. NW3]|uniref:SH3 domain-containing protein n=1 Tax=Phaeovulum sp. NW3 TaxID=2934933 RepID=UPI00202126B6|nr:SH3 domain-containing protein [Phaeovulum sp. NW3]MCL7464283.1 SH3 domain-containing protein [Phaeovulum sp. NW3]